MALTSFSFPTPTLFGAGAVRELPGHLARLGIKRPLVVTDAGLAGTPTFQILAEVLGVSQPDRSWALYSGVHPNPIESDVIEAAGQFRAQECDGVIAFGGGDRKSVV